VHASAPNSRGGRNNSPSLPVPGRGLTIAVEAAPARSDIDLVGRRAAVEQATGRIQDARRGSIQPVDELGEPVEEPLIAFLLKETQESWFHRRQRIEARA
jgi:hypothetical protein